MKSKLTLGVLAAVAAWCLCATNLFAQDDGGPGGPGGPPPGEPGPGGPVGPGDPGETGANGGPGRSFDPVQFQQRMMELVRQNLNFTNDDEWSVIQPLVQKVMEARRELGNGGMGGPPGGLRGCGTFGPQASSEQQALQKIVDDGAPVQQLKDALAKYRSARKEKQAKLEAAQNSLKAVLSTRQEAQCVLMGLLP